MPVEQKVILTRHLATINNRDRVIMGRSIDVDIVKDKQVEDFGDKIKTLVDKYKITDTNSNVLSSPLKRCISTSNIIRSILKKSDPVNILEDLIETNMGRFEGQTGTQLRIGNPILLDQWMYDPQNFQFPDGESYTQVLERVNRVMKFLTESEPKQFLFVCTHVDIIKMLLLKIQGKQFNDRRGIEVPNGNIALLSINHTHKNLEIIDTNWKS